MKALAAERPRANQLSDICPKQEETTLQQSGDSWHEYIPVQTLFGIRAVLHHAHKISSNGSSYQAQCRHSLR